MISLNSSLNSLYERTMQQQGDGWVIQSRCRLCGHITIARIAEHLHDHEADHAERCVCVDAPMIEDDPDFSSKAS